MKGQLNRFTPRIVGGTSMKIPGTVIKRPPNSDDPIFSLIEACGMAEARMNAALAEVKRQRARGTFTVDPDEFTDGPCDDAWEAWDTLAATMPTSIPGLLALIIYANEAGSRGHDVFEDTPLLDTLAKAAKVLRAVQPTD